jgi:hypothetical protein
MCVCMYIYIYDLSWETSLGAKSGQSSRSRASRCFHFGKGLNQGINWCCGWPISKGFLSIYIYTVYSYFVYSYIYKRIQCFGYEIIICSDIKNHCYYRYGVDCSYLTNYPPVSQQLDPGRGLKISFHAKLVIFRVYVNLPEGNSSSSHYNDK